MRWGLSSTVTPKNSPLRGYSQLDQVSVFCAGLCCLFSYPGPSLPPFTRGLHPRSFSLQQSRCWKDEQSSGRYCSHPALILRVVHSPVYLVGGVRSSFNEPACALLLRQRCRDVLSLVEGSGSALVGMAQKRHISAPKGVSFGYCLRAQVVPAVKPWWRLWVMAA
jgi:hypothetical protein